MNIDQPSAMVLVSLIANVAMICIAIIQALANRPASPKSEPSTPAMATAPVDAITTATNNKVVARRPRWRNSLFFIAWGQLSIVGAHLTDGASPLTTWGFSMVGQGLVMLLLGFWLLLKD